MKFEKLKQRLQNIPTEYKSIPFWSWNNELDENELVKQIEDMHSVGIGGFIMHARSGLTTEYLGEKWFSCIEACLKKAIELDMNAWVYDENGWPSGFIGGKLLENVDYRAKFLEYKVLDYFDKDAYLVYNYQNGYVLTDNPSLGSYHTLYLKTSPANTDILNPEVVDAFIEGTHEEYYRRFKKYFSKPLVGFFTDEPQYYRYETPFSKAIEREFDEEYFKNNLIYLFVEDEKGYKFRTEYYNTCNRLYVENYYKKLYDWCTDHNCMLTGHSIEESSLSGQMLGGANVMPTYRYEHIPGIDWLGRTPPSELSQKQVGSVASQLGIKHVLTETFACSGYDVTPKELKSIAEAQYFHGVNMMCHHLYPYSIAGQGKYDHPPVFSRHSNWFSQFKDFNEYFNRLGYLVSNTDEVYDVGIIHPVRSVYLNFLRRDFSSVKELEKDFNELILRLRKEGIMFQLIDEAILAEFGKTIDDCLVVGKNKYKTIIVPKMPSIASSTYELLKDYKGKILLEGNLKYIDGEAKDVLLNSNISFNDISQSKTLSFSQDKNNVMVTSRTSELGTFVFLKNMSKDSSLVKIASGNYQALDLDTLTLSNVSDEIVIDDSVILYQTDDKVINYPLEEVNVTSKFKITNITDNYYVLDSACLSYDGINYYPVRNLQGIFDDLLRNDYCGRIYLKQEFNVVDKVKLKLLTEKKKATVFLNKHEVVFKQSSFDINFVTSDITAFLQVGKNEIVHVVDYYQRPEVHFALFDPLATESLRNCLYYDTSLDNSYLVGEFIYDEGIKKKDKLPSFGPLQLQGYPFFMGEVTYVGEIEKADKTILKLNGRFLAATVYANGKETNIVLDNEKDITDILENGVNKVKICVRSSLRNLMGPHHFKPIKEPTGVSPYHFTFRTVFEGEAKDFTNEYNLVDFGITDIIVKRNK